MLQDQPARLAIRPAENVGVGGIHTGSLYLAIVPCRYSTATGSSAEVLCST
jgi:hypothetical protein